MLRARHLLRKDLPGDAIADSPRAGKRAQAGGEPLNLGTSCRVIVRERQCGNHVAHPRRASHHLRKGPSMTMPTPPSPTLELSTDAATYNVGDTLTLTAVYTDPASAPVTLTISATGTAADGSPVSATTTASCTAAEQPMQITVTDSFADSYSEVSNEAGTAVFTTVIQAPPAP